MKNARLGDAPVYLTHLVAVVDAALDLLHELEWDRRKMNPSDVVNLERAMSMLTLGRDAAEARVDAIENGPDYKLKGDAK